MNHLDRRMFDAVAGAHLPGLDQVLPRLSTAADNSLLWTCVAGGLAVTGRRCNQRAAAQGMLAIALASPLANLFAKPAFRRRRPAIEMLPLGRRLRRFPASASFPSGHTASATAFATAIAFETPKRLAVPIAILAGAVGFSRVYTGAHYPGDVAAGAAIGLGAAFITRRLWPLHGVQVIAAFCKRAR